MFNPVNAVALRIWIDKRKLEGVRWYGPYSGRGSFEGVGIVCDDGAAMMRLGASLIEHPNFSHLADGFHHQDSMGMDVIVAWYNRYFTAESLELIQ